MDILKHSGFNIDGICEMYYAPKSSVKEIGFPDSNNEVTITMNGANQFFCLYFTKITEKLTIDQVDDDSGTWFKIAMALVSPKLTAEAAAKFSAFTRQDMIFVAVDNNDQAILIGTPDKPARVSFKNSIGGGRNHRLIEIDCVADNEPYFVKELPGVSGGGFSDGFSSGFFI